MSKNDDIMTYTSKKKKCSLVPEFCNSTRVIPFTRFTVDWFRETSVVFLSHFHTDHYEGLKKSFQGDIFGRVRVLFMTKQHPLPVIWQHISFV